MFKHMKIGTKIAVGFAMITILGIIVGSAGYIVMERINGQVLVAETAYQIKERCLEARGREKDYVFRKEEKDFNKWKEAVKKVQEAAAKGRSVADDSEILAWLKDGAAELARYEKFGQAFHRLILQGKDLDNQMRLAGRAIEADLTQRPESAAALSALAKARRMEKNIIIYGDKALNRGDKTYLEMLRAEIETIRRWAGGEGKLKSLAGDYENLAMARADGLKELEKVLFNVSESAQAVLQVADRILARGAEKMQTAQSIGKTAILAILAIAVFTALVLAIFITRGITRAISRVISGLNEGAVQVAAASSQVSSSSQQLAEGASEQAAAIEETSSSLEEMAAMTRQNADNAGVAQDKMAEASKIVANVNQNMEKMIAAIGGIAKSSEETGKIIKTIDEIAFQTNLLALNAAVEAARAGEAGAGFAVVADEVRNLAMRAADAARNTSELIEDTITAVKNGNELTQATQEAFQDNTEIAMKIGGLIDEIAAASKEQAQGIDQVNKAVTEMDKVTQQNAANAEESASASEEMNAQAEQSKSMVDELIALVGGRSAENGRRKPAGPEKPGQVHPRKTSGKPAGRIGHKKGEVRPAQLIPLEKDDFKDF